MHEATRAVERRWRPSWPVDLVSTLGVLRHGAGDATLQVRASEVWRTTRTPAGPATIAYVRVGPDVLARGWGPGAALELDILPMVLGQADDPTGFDAQAHPVMSEAYRRFGAGWRVPRTSRVLEALVPAVLEQRVTGKEATRAWSTLVRQYGEPAPGPASAGAGSAEAPQLFLAPDGASWARIPSWAWHRAGVDPGRARTVVAAAARAGTVEQLSERAPDEAARALRSLPGIGVWTAAQVGARAWGDRDAVPFGDFHLARVVVHALTGRTDGTDEEMAALLTPWSGQRARAVALLQQQVGHSLPRRAPRATITDHRRW